jgi:hypothetical protein
VTPANSPCYEIVPISFSYKELERHSPLIHRIDAIDHHLRMIAQEGPVDLLSIERTEGQILQRILLVDYIVKYEKQRKFNKSLVNFYMGFFILHMALTLLGGFHLAISPIARKDFGFSFAKITLMTTAIICTCLGVCDFMLRRRLKRLDHRFIELSFPFKTVEVQLEDKTCAICFEELSIKELSMGHLASGKIAHLFHEKCATVWQKRCLQEERPRCPMCSQAVVLAPIFLAQDLRVSQARDRVASNPAHL